MVPLTDGSCPGHVTLFAECLKWGTQQICCLQSSTPIFSESVVFAECFNHCTRQIWVFSECPCQCPRQTLLHSVYSRFPVVIGQVQLPIQIGFIFHSSQPNFASQQKNFFQILRVNNCLPDIWSLIFMPLLNIYCLSNSDIYIYIRNPLPTMCMEQFPLRQSLLI